MNDNEKENSLAYLLFKKRYPAWLYSVVVIVAAVIIYLWFRSATG